MTIEIDLEGAAEVLAEIVEQEGYTLDEMDLDLLE